MAWKLNLIANDLASCLGRPKLLRNLLMVILAAALEPGCSASMLGSCSFQSGKGVGIRAELKFNKVNVPVLRRDLSRIKLVRPVWDRVHKDSIRAALVPARGASSIRENPGRDSSGDRSIPVNDAPQLPLLRALTRKPQNGMALACKRKEMKRLRKPGTAACIKERFPY
eukprot:1158288-Pelagomonas_calceolata.AAC.6